MKNYFYCLFLLCFFSCKNIALHTKTKIADTDGMKKITVNQPNFSLVYAGDYWFHSLDSRFMYVGNNFIDFIKAPIAKQKPTLSYVGHTTVEPYFNTFCLLYSSSDAKNLAENLLLNLKQSKVSNLTQKNIKINEVDFIQINYTWTDVIRKTQTMHQEYIANVDNKIVRFIFCGTLDNRESIFNQEIDNILGSLKFK